MRKSLAAHRRAAGSKPFYQKLASAALSTAASLPPHATPPVRAKKFPDPQKTPAEIAALLHEMQIHQLELEAQNHALRVDQSEISKSRDRYNDLYDFASVGYVTLDRNTKILEANLFLAAMLGLKRAKLVHLNFAEFVARESRDALYLHCRAVLATNEKQSCELLLRRRDGSCFPALVDSIRVRETGRPSRQCFRSALTDITRLKEVEQVLQRSNAELEQRVTERNRELSEAYRQLRFSEQRFRLMADQAPVMIWLAGPDNLCTWVNRQWLEFRGRTLADELGTGWSSGIYPEDRPRTVASYHQAFESRQSFILEYRLRRRDGKWRWILDHGAPLFGPDGAFNGFVGSCIDVTERKRLEKEILEISDRERSQIGHDLHDGLCQHLAAIEFKLMALKQELQAAGVDTGAGKAARAAELVRQAIDQTRMLARGLSPVMVHPGGLRNALQDLAKTTSSTFRVPASFKCPKPVLIHNNSIATHLYRIAQEAVHNAARHARPRNITLTLSALKNRFVLAIRDDGVGLPESKPNQRGMGLHIMQYRAAIIGGSLVVQREPSGGTSVVCSIRRP